MSKSRSSPSKSSHRRRRSAVQSAAPGSTAGSAAGVAAPQAVPLTSIIEDLQYQLRPGGIQLQLVDSYAEAMDEGKAFPPIDVFRHRGDLLIFAGFHRYRAAHKCKKFEISAVIHDIDPDEALRRSLLSNARHGQRLTRDEWRQACIKLIYAMKWWADADTVIASHLERNVCARTIGNWRKAEEDAGNLTPITRRKGSRAGGRLINVPQRGSAARARRRKTPPNGARKQAAGVNVAAPPAAGDEVGTSVSAPQANDGAGRGHSPSFTSAKVPTSSMAASISPDGGGLQQEAPPPPQEGTKVTGNEDGVESWAAARVERLTSEAREGLPGTEQGARGVPERRLQRLSEMLLVAATKAAASRLEPEPSMTPSPGSSDCSDRGVGITDDAPAANGAAAMAAG